MENTVYINHYLDEERKLLDRIDGNLLDQLLQEILNAYEREGNIYIFGNGGSASTASHFANDFNKGISEFTEKKFHVCCLNDNISTVMAIANDISYDSVFEFQMRGKVSDRDLVIGISGSGNSENVIRGISLANQVGAMTAGLCGFTGGKLSKEAQIVIHVPSNSMQLVEDIHMIFCHTLMSACLQKWGLNK